MPITPAQTKAIMEVVNSLLTTTSQKKRQIAAMFLVLVDRTDWPQYYEVIPEPRCLNNIKAGIEKNRYKDAMDVYTDLSLVFWNALFYNEPDSQIGIDAQTLKTVLETEWKKHSILPLPRSSPPPSSAQKVHRVVGGPAAPAPVPTVVATPSPRPARTATPAAVTHTTPASVANTSTTSAIYTKPIPIRPRSAQRLSTDMDVDIMSDADGGGDETSAITERDPESEEIIKQLEKGLPRWPGFGEGGWVEDVSPDRIIEIVHAVKNYKDIVSGHRVAVALEAVPEESSIPHLSYTIPLSLKIIENHARSKSYTTAKDFGLEMARLFEKSRLWHKPSTEAYGRVLLLQRLFQALMSQDPPPGPPYHTTTNFASPRAGPGNVKPVHTGGVSGGGLSGGGNGGADDSAGAGVAGVTTHRVLTKDRTFVDEVHYMGWTLKLADWVHLSNPDDPSRPIVAQVFRCWVSEEASKRGQQGITVSWYFRPEQTFHPANRTFWEGEVFKTSHFAEHPLEDVIEKIACQFTARHIRGRPRPPFWYLGFPLYVCDSRYNDRDRLFVRIKNWNSCVPEEVRKKEEFMPIYPFEKTLMPERFPSPFLGKGQGGSGKKGPGGILLDTIGVEKVVKEEEKVGGVTEVVRKRPRRAAAAATEANKGGTTIATPSSLPAQYQPSSLTQQAQIPGHPRPDRSVVTAAGGLAVLGQGAHVEKLPAETAKHFDRDPETNEVLWFPAPPVDVPRRATPKYSLAYLHFLATKGKRELAEDGDDGDAMDVDEHEELESSTHAKRARLEGLPSVTETLRALIRRTT